MFGKVKKALKRQALQKTPQAFGKLASLLPDERKKAYALARVRPQMIKRTVAAVLAVFITALAVFGLFRLSADFPETPSAPTQPSTHGQIGLIIVSAAGTEAEEQVSIPTRPDFTMELPVKGLLVVEPLADDTDRTRIAAEHHINEKMRNYLQYLNTESLTYRVAGRSMPNVMVGYGTLNTFILCGLDTEDLDNIRISLDGFGVMEVEPVGSIDWTPSTYLSSTEIVITKEQYQQLYCNSAQMDGTALFTFWNMSGQMLILLNSDPNLPLSFFKAVVTFTVSYTNGESQSFQVEITFNDNGEMRAVYKR